MSHIIACNNIETLHEQLKMLVSKEWAILVDSNTEKHCLPLLADFFGNLNSRVISIPAGEASKSLQTAETIWSAMLQLNISRNSTLVCFGGGVVTDIGGFCAAAYKRGIPFIHIPTSLLGMVDASIGGKTGINLNTYKNMVGSFSQPDAVLLYPGFLETLPTEEMLNGSAEMLKHSLILDAEQWHQYRTQENWLKPGDKEIFRSANLKKHATLKDPTETGYRKILNFGHTIGHALESLYAEKRQALAHGLAVAAGMLMEACICREKELLSKTDFQQIAQFISGHFPKITFSTSDYPKIQAAMQADKKSDGRSITIAGIKAPGKAIPAIPVSESEVLQALEYYRSN